MLDKIIIDAMQCFWVNWRNQLPRWKACQYWTNGLHLFSDDTRPSGHRSRPREVDVSQSCVHSLNRLIKPDDIVQVLGLVEVKKNVSVGGWFTRGIVWNIWSFKSDIKFCLSQEFHHESLGNYLRVFNESVVKYSLRLSCNTAHSRSMISVWPRWW